MNDAFSMFRSGLTGACVFFCMTTATGATLSVGTESHIAGFSSVELNVRLSSGPDEEVAAAQFDIVFDPLLLELHRVRAGNAVINAQKDVAGNWIAPGQYRVLISGFNMNTIEDGALVWMLMSSLPGAPEELLPVSLAGAVLSDSFGSPIAATTVPGGLDVVYAPIPIGWQLVLGLMLAAAGVRYTLKGR